MALRETYFDGDEQKVGNGFHGNAERARNGQNFYSCFLLKKVHALSPAQQKSRPFQAASNVSEFKFLSCRARARPGHGHNSRCRSRRRFVSECGDGW